MADQQQLYSSISEMKIATPVKVEVFTEGEGRKRNKERPLERESYATCMIQGSHGAGMLNLANYCHSWHLSKYLGKVEERRD